MQREQAVDAVDRLALGVGAVELDVGERPLGQLPLLLDLGRPLGLRARGAAATASARSARSSSVLAALELALHAAPRPGNDHSGTMIGWPSLS